MLQKYRIHISEKDNRLTIQEYAELDKDIFSLLHEEEYDGDLLQNAAAEGLDSLVKALRRPSLYPSRPHAEKLADSVFRIFDEKDSTAILEVAFDDKEQLQREREEAMEDFSEEEDDGDVLDELLVEDGDDKTRTPLKVADDAAAADDEESE